MDVRKCRRSTVNRVNNLPEEWKNIDVLINNAGLTGLDPIQNGDIGDWDRMIDTNIKGHIVNLGSIAGKEVYPNGNVYCATKHAVDALNKAMRIDLLSKGIKVTGINPGMVETEFSEVRFHGDTDRAAAVYKDITPLSGKDIAETIAFVLSRPAHVNINDLLIMPVAQATGKQKIGRELMRRAVDSIMDQYGSVDIRIGAQLYLKAFYESFGFQQDSEEYLEDGIPHIEMLRKPQ
ncbi:hypothetical protein FQR65_LT17393 [Abscondita terminalis]|nr:hypothetical protein FQR65_LT17393 [Abscondita terminalis]